MLGSLPPWEYIVFIVLIICHLARGFFENELLIHSYILGNLVLGGKSQRMCKMFMSLTFKIKVVTYVIFCFVEEILMDANDLEAFFKLKEKGIITEEEFEAKKREFLKGGADKAASLGIIDNYVYCVQNSFNMKGRANRPEFWFFFLANVIIFFILLVISALLDSQSLFLLQLFQIFQILPTYGVVVRRFHDLNMEAGWASVYLGPSILNLMTMFNQSYSDEFIIFTLLINLICGVLLIIFMCTKGDDGENRFGEAK